MTVDYGMVRRNAEATDEQVSNLLHDLRVLAGRPNSAIHAYARLGAQMTGVLARLARAERERDAAIATVTHYGSVHLAVLGEVEQAKADGLIWPPPPAEVDLVVKELVGVLVPEVR